MLSGEVTAILGAKVNPAGFVAYDAAMGKATASAAKAEAAQGKLNASMLAGGGAASKFGGVARSAAAGGALVLAAGLAKSISAAASFDKQMDRIGAVTNASAKDMKAMANVAKDMGQKMGVGATEAAKAMEALAKGGLTTTQILEGGLAGALQLAQSGTMEVGAAAEATANALNLFGLSGDKATHVADALSIAAADTTADVSDFAIALSQGGSAAKIAGLSFDETVVALESLAKIGVKGSDAGTSLKAALLQVIDPSDEAAATMKKLGIDFTDATGKMKPLGDVAEMLRDKIGKLSKEEQVAALKRLAGTDGFRSLAALMEQGGSGVDKLSGSLEKQGTAAKTAEKNTDNLTGAWNRLKSSIQNLAIEAGGPFLEPLQDGLDSLAQSLDDLREGKGDLAAVASDVKDIGSALGDVFDALNIGDMLGTSFTALFSGLGQAISGVVGTLRSVVTGDIGGIFSGLANIVVGSLKAVTAPLRGLGAALVGPFRAAGSAILGVFSSIIGGIAKVAETMAGIPGIGRVWKKAAEGAREAQGAIDGLRDSINGVKKPKPVTIDTSQLKSALRDIAGTKVEPKVMKILANDKDAKSKTKALIALGIPPKTAKLLADAANLLAGAATAKQAIERVPAGKTVTINVQAIGLGVIAGVQQAINNLQGKTVKVGARARGRGPGGSELAVVGEGRHAREAVVDPATGFAAMVDRPTLMGLSSSAYVIPEDPMQRGKSMGLLSMLAEDLGLRGFAASKKPAKRAKAAAAKKAPQPLGLPDPGKVMPAELPLAEMQDLEQKARKSLTDATGKVHDLPDKIKAAGKRVKDIRGRNAKTAATKAKKARDLADAREDHAKLQQSLAANKKAVPKRRADWNDVKKDLAQARRFQAAITKTESLADIAANEMRLANLKGDAGAWNTAKGKRVDALRVLQQLLGNAAKITGKPNSQIAADIAKQLSDANVTAQELEGDKFSPDSQAADEALSDTERARLTELDRDAALAALTDPTGDDLSTAQAREGFLSGLLGAAQSSGRSAGVVGELATLVKQARDDVSSLQNDRTPDMQAQIDRQAQIIDLATRNAAANANALAVFAGSGDIGSGGGNAWRAATNITVNTLHPGSPDTLAAIAAASNAGNALQNGIQSSRLAVG